MANAPPPRPQANMRFPARPFSKGRPWPARCAIRPRVGVKPVRGPRVIRTSSPHGFDAGTRSGWAAGRVKASWDP